MTQDLVNIVVGVAGTAMGWMLKVVWDSIRVLQDEMKSLERVIHTKYVSKDDYKDDIRDVKEMLNAIFKRLEQKADK
jgi:hypothetical protein